MSFHISKITTEDLYHIRHKVLRPNQTIDDCKYPGDEDKDSFHLGVFAPDLVSIASFYRESQECFKDRIQYRLRGMATLPEYQGQGMAKNLLSNALLELQKRSADLLWCNARTTAVAFYQGLDFKKYGEEFNIDPIGPHFVYAKKL